MNKIVIVVLILIIVLFVIFVARGSLTEDQPHKPADSNQAKKDAKNIPSAWSSALESLFGGFQQTVVLECARKLSNSERRCEELPKNITVPAAEEPSLPFLKKTTFRTVKLVKLMGKATIIYRDIKGAKNGDKPLTFDLPNRDNNDSTIESLAVGEDGGILTILCQGNVPCQVGQE
jgi:hypothetical protein